MGPNDLLTVDLVNAAANPGVSLDGQVEADQLADGTIPPSKLLGGITADKLVDRVITPIKVAEQAQAMTSGGTPYIDCSTGYTFACVMTNNITNINLNNMQDGQTVMIAITQPSSGSTFSVTWNLSLNIKWRGGTAPTMTATLGKTDIFYVTKIGANYYGWANQNF
jgi:hypothetical protein